MNKRYLSSTLASIGMGLCLMAAPPVCWAAENFSASDQATKAKKSKQAKAPKLPTDKGSAEGRAERDKRLLRECRGKANTGACEGYAS